MRLDQVLHGVDAEALAGPPPDTVEVRAVASDSRQAGPGVLFVAVPGTTGDGHAYAPAAVRAGSPAVIVERQVDGLAPATVLRVPSSRVALGQAAANLHHRPGERLPLVGVTGTNGKTTVTWLLEAIAAAAGRRPGVLGTTGHRFAGTTRAATHTTPGPEALQALLAEMLDAGVDLGVMEVSSHALDQARVEGCAFRVAAFTNLTRDHLDYHPSLEAYFEAKARLFGPYLADGGAAVVSADDPAGVRLLDRLAGRPVRRIATSVAPARTELAVTPGPAGDVEWVRAESAQVGLEGIRAQVALPSGRVLALTSPLTGVHNLQNLLTAVGLAVALGLPDDAIARGLATCPGAPGRLERVADKASPPRHVFVDYAHTDDALARVIGALRELSPAGTRLVVVFGCGGDRDPGKRPLMGKAACGGDTVVVTSDNPRSEDPRAIIDDILPGMDPNTPRAVEPDRRRAIELAVGLARPGDVVLVAGKGHETTQTAGGVARPFDDRVVCAGALAAVAPGTREVEKPQP